MYRINFDYTSSSSQYQQLVNKVRQKITDGRIPGETRIVSPREMASRFQIARGNVVEAYDQIKMEGYLKGFHGSGTFVMGDLVWYSFNPAPSVGTTYSKNNFY